MNVVNKITLSRILIVPLFMFSLEMKGISWHIFSMLCFFYATFSDFLDGYIARRDKIITDFGKIMDPLADKIFISSAFIYFVSNKNLLVPAWAVTLILAREFLITGFRTVAISDGIVLAAQKSGKYKTSFQLVFIFIEILLLILIDLFGTSVIDNLLIFYFIKIYVYLLTIFTTISGVLYIYKYRKILK